MTVSQFELGMFEERTQQGWLSLGLAKRLSHGLSEVWDVLRNEIGQIGVLGPRPDLFIRIEFGGIGGQPFNPQSAREPLPESPSR